MKFSFNIKNDKECSNFIIGPNEIVRKAFKNDCPKTPGPILKKKGPKTGKKVNILRL